MIIAKQNYMKTLKCIIFCQSCIRRKKAKKELRRLKMQAKDVDHIKSLNKGLENKILQLQIKVNKQNDDINNYKKIEIEKNNLNEKLLSYSEIEKSIKDKDLSINELIEKIKELELIVDNINNEKEKQNILIENSKENENNRQIE